MSTEIFEGATGRSISTYDLLDETMETYGLDKTTAHEAITAFLSGLTDDDSSVIIERTPTRPQLLTSNPNHVDIDHWLTVSNETADHIRGALAASFEPAAAEPQVTVADIRNLLASPAESPVLYVKRDEDGDTQLDVWAEDLVAHGQIVAYRHQAADALGDAPTIDEIRDWLPEVQAAVAQTVNA
ncbi:hypothetical protein ACH5AG_08540 [Streptomyces anulatus]